MEKYKTNLMTIDNIFKSIESHFVFTSDNAQKKILFKNISHSNLRKRPNIKKHNKHDKILPNEKSNQLDLIGNDDLIFNNDKLITSMKIGDIEEISDEVYVDTRKELKKWVKYAIENKSLILFDAAYERYIFKSKKSKKIKKKEFDSNPRKKG